METLTQSTGKEKFVYQMQLKNFTSQTQKNYLWHLERFMAFVSQPPARYSSQLVNSYLITIKDKGDSFRNQSINAIRFFFTYVLNREIKDWLVIRPKKSFTQPILLSEDEIKSMLSVCDNLKHKAIIYLILSAGLRVSEIVNLKIKDVDSKLMVLRIKKAKGRKDRTCRLDIKCLDVLRQYFKKYRPEDYLFNGQKSLQYTSRSIEEFVKQYALKAGIKKRVYPHLLRHQQITSLLESGNDILATQLHSGHQKIATTANYIHLSPKFISQMHSPVAYLT